MLKKFLASKPVAKGLFENAKSGVFGDEGAQANARMDKVLDALKNKDSSALKALFSKNTVSKVKNFDKSIQQLFDYYEGDYKSYNDWGGPNISGGRDEGLVFDVLESTYDVKTSKEVFRFAIWNTVIDERNQDNIGITSLYIIKMKDDTLPQYAYWGDGKNTPGINIGKTE